MFTRSRGRVERERSRTSERQRRAERVRKQIDRQHSTPPYSLRSSMGRRGVSTNEGIRNRSTRVESSAVTPIRLFSVTKNDINFQDSCDEVNILAHLFSLIIAM